MESVPCTCDSCLFAGSVDLKVYNDWQDTGLIVQWSGSAWDFLVLAHALLPLGSTLLLQKYIKNQADTSHYHYCKIRVCSADDLRCCDHHLPERIQDELHTSQWQRILQLVILRRSLLQPCIFLPLPSQHTHHYSNTTQNIGNQLIHQDRIQSRRYCHVHHSLHCHHGLWQRFGSLKARYARIIT